MIKYLNFKNKIFSTCVKEIPVHKKALFIDQNVFTHFYQKMFQVDDLSIDIFILPSKENIKTRSMKDQLEDKLFKRGYTKDSLLIAVGGGTVSDLIGYLASTFCRGVSLILVPTTLVGMIDACIGGKNGINTQFGKNLLGTIYLPSKVWIDPSFLSTLQLDQIQEGLMEMIKHGLIFDRLHFEEVLSLKQKPSLNLIQRSIQIKEHFVNADVKDQSIRQILNFGHTFAHALESLSQYQISHGKALVAGILIESYISYLENNLSIDDFRVINQAISPLIDPRLHKIYPIKDWEKVLLFDKKNKQGQIYSVRIKTIGKAILPKPIKQSTLIKAIQWFEKNACVCSR